jgi:AraC-like DNA-binding protein
LVISTLSYYSFQQPQLFSDELSLSRISDEPTQNDLLASTSENSLSDQEKILFIQKLENVMTTQKPFLNPKIRMPELAHSLNIPRHIFSALINEHYQMNFFHFINQYRVEYAKTLLVDKEYQHYTLESIGELSGFNSRSTFNRIFKNVTGKSPKEFQQMK